ncbi:MAG: putative toxin-antitoxin system toxin component, PIN family [Caldilineales bacterium]|nr:putative toxin-antitoxin system toxin component, PIN family [Caldilineales bacterium]
MTAPPLRIVLDTNVYISAALHGRQAEAALQLAAARQIVLLTSPTILAELERKLTSKLGWSENQVRLFIDTIRGVSDIVEPQQVLHVVPDDEDDNRIIECAVAGEAALIVTFDQDLLRLQSYETIGIISPRQLTFYRLDRNRDLE